jgi:hypothetical protein
MERGLTLGHFSTRQKPSPAGLEVPDAQYEMLEDIAHAGWQAAFPDWVDPPEGMDSAEFGRAVDAWLAFMEAAALELAKRNWKLARLQEQSHD